MWSYDIRWCKGLELITMIVYHSLPLDYDQYYSSCRRTFYIFFCEKNKKIISV